MTTLDALSIAAAVRSGERTARSFAEAALREVAAGEAVLHTMNVTMPEVALAAADAVDAVVASGGDPGPLAGVPIAVKDNLCTIGVPTTCSSRILEGWIPPYDATTVRRIVDAGAVMVGKTNLDEFAMGSSTENSAFGPTKNPWDIGRVPGGSSGGSAAVVASGSVPLALGSDTGGSIRQPAAFCGVVGVKPTYGLVSRYGLIAFASSLDQVGPFAGTVADAGLLLETIAGHDPADSTSLDVPVPELSRAIAAGVDDLRIGIIEEFLDGASPKTREAVEQAAAVLATSGAKVATVSIPELLDGLAAYYLIAPAEASSNLSRYDGVRYGLRVDGADVAEMNAKTRGRGFGDEVKRRIMLGTYVLSAGYYDAYYSQAQRVRTLVVRAFARAYEQFDALICPVTPSVAFEFGSKTRDPFEMYLSDLYTIPSNLAGHPAMSVPFALGEDDLPVGVQVLAPALGEETMFSVAAVLESAQQRGSAAPGGLELQGAR
jgi:aspartyl-tRNA(Asn)/glutamyl-tRNA(Gln) amidotransferase subunit A